MDRLAMAAAIVRTGSMWARDAAAAFGVTLDALNQHLYVEMWAELRRKRWPDPADVEPALVTVIVEPSPDFVAAGLKLLRLAPADMPKLMADMREAAWSAGWSTWSTRALAEVPRKRKRDGRMVPVMVRERRATLWLERGDQRAVGTWLNGGWENGSAWRLGQWRRQIGYGELCEMIG